MAIDRAKVEQIIGIMRGALVADGGDITLVDISEDGVVMVELHGSCSSCPMSSYDLSMGVERVLKEHVPGVTSVVAVND